MHTSKFVLYLHAMWQEIDNKLVRQFKFKDFQEAFTFMTSVALLAERLNHHPTWYNEYNVVTIELTTHSSGNMITEKDRELAQRINQILGEQSNDTSF